MTALCAFVWNVTAIPIAKLLPSGEGAVTRPVALSASLTAAPLGITAILSGTFSRVLSLRESDRDLETDIAQTSLEQIPLAPFDSVHEPAHTNVHNNAQCQEREQNR